MKNIRTLVVDDSRSVRSIISQALSNINFDIEVEEAADGEEALEKFVLLNFDIVLLDINMPKLDGIKVLREIRKRNPNQFVVMITSNITIDFVTKAKKLGADGYVAKPFNTEKISQVVKAYNDRADNLEIN